MEWHEDLENVCQQAGLKGKKLSKVFYFNKIAILIVMSSYFPVAIIIGSKLENLLWKINYTQLQYVFWWFVLFLKKISKPELNCGVFFLFAGNGKLLMEHQSVKGTSRSLEPSKERKPRILTTSQSYFSSPDFIVLISLLSCPHLVWLSICLSICSSVCLFICLWT